MIEHGYTIGVDVGGTNIKFVAVSDEGEVRERFGSPTRDSAQAVWIETVSQRVSEMEGRFGPAGGIGVSCPGIAANHHRWMTWMAGRMEAVVGLDWTERLGKSFFIPVLNDAKAALLAEAWIGAAEGVQNVMLLTLGTGVGGAAIVDGRLLHGAVGRAGHLGHISLDPYGPGDICRTPGSLEDKIGGVTLRERSNGAFSDTAELVRAAKAGDVHAASVWRRSIESLAAGLVSLINVLDPEVVILGGGMLQASGDLLDPLAAILDSIEWRPFGDRVAVVPAKLGEYAGAIGAARFSMISHMEKQ